MKTYTFYFLLSFLFIGIPDYAFAQTGELVEVINDFTTEIEVRENGTIHVEETIVYDFRMQDRRGIIRDIPLTDAPGTFNRMSIENIRVTNERSMPYDFEVTGDTSPLWSKVFGGLALENEMVTIRVGNPLIPVWGVKTYVISYDVKNAVGYFDDRVEIYWNTTGQEWLVPIKQASARVTVPGDQSTTLKLASYCGRDGSTAPCEKRDVHFDEKNNTTQVMFVAPGELSSSEGMTVAVGFPKNLIASPSAGDLVLHYVCMYWGFALVPILVYLWFRKLIARWLVRRRFYRDHTVVAEYDAGGFNPLEVAGILKGAVSTADISAHIIYLATRGYLIIHKYQSNAYTFTDTGKREGLTDFDKELVTALANKPPDELKNSFYQKARALPVEVLSGLKDKGYLFSISPKKSKIGMLVATFFIAINPGMFIWIILGAQAGIAFSGTSVLIGILSLFVSSDEDQLTLSGLEAARKLKGLRLYIDVAEDDRIEFHNAPEKNLELFEKLLPFAMVFDLEKKWAKEFEHLYVSPPSWYDHSFQEGFSSRVLADSLNDFTKTTATSLFVGPASYSSIRSSGSSFGSSGSSSGSSGRGSSGGGGGGGGGRSW
ncbi:MAG: hypothetical protein RLZZ480_281 [Candidatus Parcubacteria bacterium]|jgi:uncharacterized membrane protein YgcG